MSSDSQLTRIEQKVDKLDERLDRMDVRFAKYNTELEFHIARTNQVEDTLVPIVEHVRRVNATLAVLGVIGTIVGLAATVYAVLK